MDTTRHHNSIALVTGAASGIGRATAVRLAGEGATVVATDGNGDGLTSLSAEVPGIITVQGDLRDAGFITHLVGRAEAVGPVATVANVAGVTDRFLPVSEVDDEMWTQVFEINVTAPMRICRAIIPLMTARGGGAIVNVASVTALGGSGGGVSYVASKHASVGLTRHIAFTYGPQGIRCNAVCPGGVDTPIDITPAPSAQWAYERQLVGIAVGGFDRADPDEIATAISWLASSEASNVNGIVMPVDGGWKSA